MALINCPECQKEISDKATSCPDCGYPTGDDIIFKIKNMSKGIESLDLPNDLSIGRVLSLAKGNYAQLNWAGIINGEDFHETEFPIEIIIHKHGIRIKGNTFLSKGDIMRLHFKQIIEIFKIDSSKLKAKDVIGPAALGGLMLGLTGAIIGGMSSVGQKEKIFYLYINYWDVKDKKTKGLLLSGNELAINAFMQGFNEIKNKIKKELTN